MTITYLGHSALRLETGSVSVLVDPFITGNPAAEAVVRLEELAPDVILITHAHGDHWGDTEALVAKSGAMVVANHEIVTYLEKKTGHSNVRGMNIGGSLVLPWGTVKQTYARHSSSFPDGTYGGNPNGYMVEVGDHYIYIAGDTSTFAEMEWLGRDYDIDVAFLPVGDTYTMGIEDAVRAARLLRPGLTVPVHYNTFAAIEVDVTRWESMMLDAGLAPKVLMAGETLSM
ncbi:MAG: L-ascorbate metabolism protein UlaG (beta-lactamase superfamily) [Rhodothermales bacterium]|jgi:L-ascorbate metabolism protein UlaG (beta-lactamase superfamily)